MAIDDADEKVTLTDTESGSSSVFIFVCRDPRPLMCHIEPTRFTAIVLIAIGRNNDRRVRLYLSRHPHRNHRSPLPHST